MLPDRVSNPGPLTYESGALPTALRGPALSKDLQGLQKVRVGVVWAYFHSSIIFFFFLPLS